MRLFLNQDSLKSSTRFKSRATRQQASNKYRFRNSFALYVIPNPACPHVNRRLSHIRKLSWWFIVIFTILSSIPSTNFHQVILSLRISSGRAFDTVPFLMDINFLRDCFCRFCLIYTAGFKRRNWLILPDCGRLDDPLSSPLGVHRFSSHKFVTCRVNADVSVCRWRVERCREIRLKENSCTFVDALRRCRFLFYDFNASLRRSESAIEIYWNLEDVSFFSMWLAKRQASIFRNDGNRSSTWRFQYTWITFPEFMFLLDLIFSRKRYRRVNVATLFPGN